MFNYNAPCVPCVPIKTINRDTILRAQRAEFLGPVELAGSAHFTRYAIGLNVLSNGSIAPTAPVLGVMSAFRKLSN